MNSTSPARSSRPKLLAKHSAKRAFSVIHAFCTAFPFKSVPLEAAVGEVLGTLSVRVAVTSIISKSSPNSLAAIWPILV